MRKSLIMVLAVLLLAGAASAGSTMTLPVNTKEVDIGSSTDFKIVLDTSHSGPGTISWTTSDPAITATLDGGTLATSGQIDVTTVPFVEQPHTLTVAIGAGAVAQQEYSVDVNYCFEAPGNGKAVCGNGKIKAKAQATVIPTPELSTILFTATGFVGLLGLVRMRRKE
jgi:hypothetical protein